MADNKAISFLLILLKIKDYYTSLGLNETKKLLNKEHFKNVNTISELSSLIKSEVNESDSKNWKSKEEWLKWELKEHLSNPGVKRLIITFDELLIKQSQKESSNTKKSNDPELKINLGDIKMNSNQFVYNPNTGVSSLKVDSYHDLEGYKWWEKRKGKFIKMNKMKSFDFLG